MATKWTAARIEQLFYLNVNDIKVNSADVSQKWSNTYPDDEFQPTARAIVEKLGTLKKKYKNIGAHGFTGPNETSSTPTGATKWNSSRMEKLFLIVSVDQKFDCGQLSQKWKKAYPNDTFQPTPRAITEKLATLKKQHKANGGEVMTPTTTTTPASISCLQITSASSSRSRGASSSAQKRKRGAVSSDEESMPSEDSDTDPTEDDNDPRSPLRGLPRTNAPRRARGSRVTFDEATDEDSGASEGDYRPIKRGKTGSGEQGSASSDSDGDEPSSRRTKHVIPEAEGNPNLVPQRNSIARSKRAAGAQQQYCSSNVKSESEPDELEMFA